MKPRRALRPAAALASLALACAPASPPPTEVSVVVDPGSFGSIEEAATAEAQVEWWVENRQRDRVACTESFAATELQRFLPACLGIPSDRVRISSSLPDRGDAIVLSTRAAGAHGGEADLTGGGFRIRMSRQHGRRVVAIEGRDRAGTLYGSYALLEQLGARFHGLGDTGTVLPSRPARWPRRLDLDESPAFVTRGFWAWEPRGNRDFFLWMARNRMNLWTAADTAFVPLMKKLGFQLTGGGHTIQAEFLPPQRYSRAHPEWFGLHDGKRSPNIRGEAGDNFCTSNAEARRALAANLVRSLAGGRLRHVDVLELWMLDGGRWCECEPCRLQGAPTDRLLDVADEVAAAALSARREGALWRPVEVATLAYLETLGPPSRPRPPRSLGAGVTVTWFPYFRCYAHALDDSLCTEINRRLASGYRAWAGWEGRPGHRWAIGEYYNVGAFKSLPLVFPHTIGRDLAWYRDHGATRFSYMHAPTRWWGSWTLKHAVLAALLWNPRADVDSLIADFCRRSYPGAASRMQAFFGELETATSNIVALQHCAGVYGTREAGGRLAQRDLPVFPLRHLREHPSAVGPDRASSLDEMEAAVGRARSRIDGALAACRDPLERARVADVERRFTYGEAMLRFYAALIRTAAADRVRDGEAARAAFTRAEELAERLRAVRDLVQVASSHANASDGLEASGVQPTYEHFRGLYGRH